MQTATLRRRTVPPRRSKTTHPCRKTVLETRQQCVANQTLEKIGQRVCIKTATQLQRHQRRRQCQHRHFGFAPSGHRTPPAQGNNRIVLPIRISRSDQTRPTQPSCPGISSLEHSRTAALRKEKASLQNAQQRITDQSPQQLGPTVDA